MTTTKQNLKPFKTGSKGGPGRGKTKLKQGIEDAMANAKEPINTPTDAMRAILADKTQMANIFAAILKDNPTQIPKLLQAVTALNDSPMAPDSSRDKINVICRFPPLGAAESDYTQYRLVERAEAAEMEKEKMTDELDRLREEANQQESTEIDGSVQTKVIQAKAKAEVIEEDNSRFLPDPMDNWSSVEELLIAE